jgi:hypothetical protein
MGKPQKWELWFADFPHDEDTTVTNDRPIVLVNIHTDGSIFALMITKHEVRDENDMEIFDWQAAGLAYPSVIRTLRRFKLPPDKLRRKIGLLSDTDIIRLKFKIGS